VIRVVCVIRVIRVIRAIRVIRVICVICVIRVQHRASNEPRGTFRKSTPDQRSANLLTPALPRSIRI